MSIWFVDSVRFAFYLVWIYSANAASNTEKRASADGAETETARGFVWRAQIPAPRTIQDRRMSACERNLPKSRPSGAHPPRRALARAIRRAADWRAAVSGRRPSARAARISYSQTHRRRTDKINKAATLQSQGRCFVY